MILFRKRNYSSEYADFALYISRYILSRQKANKALNRSFSLEIHFIVLEWIKILTMLRGHKSLRVKLSVFLLFSICYFHNFRALNVFVIIFCQKCISFSSQQFIFKTFGVSFKICSKTSHYKDLNTKLPILKLIV